MDDQLDMNRSFANASPKSTWSYERSGSSTCGAIDFQPLADAFGVGTMYT